MIQWCKNLVACWNHERTLRKFAKGSPFTLRDIRRVYGWVHSYEKLELIIDLAQEENISLVSAYLRISYKE